MKRYLAHFRPHWPVLVASAALLSVTALVPGAAVLLLQQTLDDVLVGGRHDRLAALCLAFGGLYLLAGALKLLRARLTKGVAWKVTSDLRRQLHAHYLRLDPSQQAGTGARLAALTDQVDQVQYGVSALVTAVRNPLTLLALAATAVWMAPDLAAWAVLLAPAVALTAHWGGRRVHHAATEVRKTRAALTALAQEQLAGVQTIQSFGVEADESARFEQAEEADRLARQRLEVDRLLPSVAVQSVAAAAIGVMLWVGGQRVLAGTLQAGQLVAFAVALGLMNRPLGGLSEVWSLLQRALAALDQVYATLDTVPAIRGGTESVPEAPTLRWDGVHAGYGDPVVHDVRLDVAPGELLALVGPSGSGKTTLLRLAGRLLDPQAGAVTLGGVDLRQLELGALRRAVAVVRQDDQLFARTVEENLAFARPDAARPELERAARQAGALDFIEALPQGWQTPVEELGRRLSGGERQRLCVARALLTHAPVLLLDEATNQIDAETERAVLDALRSLNDTAVVVVAHNLAAACVADRIAVVDRGRIVETGTHAELMGLGGHYARIWRLQEAA